MNLFDVPARSRRSLGAEEHAACALGLALFPLLAFLIPLLGRDWVWDYAELPLLGLPAVLSLLSYLAARRLGTSTAFALKLVFGCGVACFMTTSAAALLSGIISFLETF